ncbi:hypothetical protein RhiirC2_794907 [Rhizophagus irregularis]|uniref:MULE transposase domain-containing protein n=1 Tax=Rhizophagus irregularis TaxID=588596 RepID=A0A2N1MCN9_9GLOM|nr:hypothetical protein RhiirC2_794907 [Rhizophagus irregularis]
MSDWLDKQKEQDPKWIVIWEWDDNNVLTHLIWMTPEQVENWIQFSNCIINDGLIVDESKQSHSWLFRQIVEATSIYPTVIITDADPAVDAAVKKDFYLCRNSLVWSTFHDRFMKLIENYPQSKSYLEVLYTSKEYWAHSYTSFRFTEGMIASSHVESVNTYIKRMLFNSNVSLCELMSEIHKLINEQDKKNKYEYWKLAIPSIKNLEHANFLFTEVDKCCQNFLMPAILKLQRDEINQSLYYTVKVSGHDNVKEIWVVRVGNSQTAKHHIVLLKNDAHICFCLMIIQKGIVCKDALREPFIIADKFHEGNTTNKIQESNVIYLCAVNKEKDDQLGRWMNILDEKIMYKDFANEDNEFESEDEELDEKEFDDSDKKNINVVQLQNPKLKRGKERLVGTKRYKASLKLPAETL